MADATDTNERVADVASEAASIESELAAFQFADSFLPVGAYTASYGLEQFIESDVVGDAEDLQRLLTDYLRQQFGPCDVIALTAAYEASAADDLEAIVAADQRQHAVTLAAEFRKSSTSAGGRLLDLAVELLDDSVIETYADRVAAGEAPGNYAVVTGLVAQREGIPVERARLLAGHSFVVGLLGAAQRLASLGHTETQVVLTELRPVLATVCTEYAESDLTAMRTFAPRIELMGMAHERADRRLFVS
jgi:urease accessory protein